MVNTILLIKIKYIGKDQVMRNIIVLSLKNINNNK